MEFSTFALIVFSVLAMIVIVCTVILYPELRDIIRVLKRDP